MNMRISMGETVLYVVRILWLSYSLHGQPEEQSYLWKHWFWEYHLFSSSFVGMIVEGKKNQVICSLR